MSLRDRLAGRKLLVVTGKGGTGKSVMTAALGRVLAAGGRRTLILEVDPRENLHHLCGVPPSDGEITEVGPNLWLQNLKPATVADWVVREKVKIGPVVKRLLASPVYQRFVDGAPGLKEIAILGHVLRWTGGDLPGVPPVETLPLIDTVVLDAPATGHGVYLLTAASLYVEAIGEGPFAELAHQVARFVEDPELTGLVIVTLAEEMPVQESLELRLALREKLARVPDLLVTNALYPSFGEEAVADPLVALWRDRRLVNEKELRRLATHWDGPRLELPLLPIDEGPALLDALTRLLDAGLEADSEGKT